MPGTLPHTQNGFAQTAAEQHFREQLDEETAARPHDAEVRRQSGGDATTTPAATPTTARADFNGSCAREQPLRERNALRSG